MSLSAPISALVEHLGQHGSTVPPANDELAAVLAAFAGPVAAVRLGGWEVGVFGEPDARAQLAACGAQSVLERHASFRGIGNDAGVHTAVVGWTDQEPEVVYVLDAEYQTAAAVGTVAVWLARLALDDDSALAAAVNPIRLEPGEMPPEPSYSPDPTVEAALKGGQHLAWAEVGGVPVAVHKKGVRAWIGGKKKAKSAVKGSTHHWDHAGGLVWHYTPFAPMQLGCISLPDLATATLDVPRCTPSPTPLAALPGAAVRGVDSAIEVVVWRDGGLVPAGRYETGLPSPWLRGSHGPWVLADQAWQKGALLLRWDGERM
ncbi:MAG: hypothetical protein KC656_07860, partial [Myxococcales bacterium]|nr:hypothetical protein [Myxococcales bacterium]